MYILLKYISYIDKAVKLSYYYDVKESERKKVIVMGTEFDKKIMFDNISFILKEVGKKIGELEAEAGVSAGYISRSSKDSNAKPGIDFIVNVSEALNVSIDTLLKVDLSSLSPTEKYLISFIDKLKRDTMNDKLYWNSESADELNSLKLDENGCSEHPLFEYETFYVKGETDYPEEMSKIIFSSKAFGHNTYINGNCFNLRLKNGVMLYLMSISKAYGSYKDGYYYVKELWMYQPGKGKHFLCNNLDNSVLSSKIIDLYASIEESLKHPKIIPPLKYVIDSFMNDDIEDDVFDGDLPF